MKKQWVKPILTILGRTTGGFESVLLSCKTPRTDCVSCPAGATGPGMSWSCAVDATCAYTMFLHCPGFFGGVSPGDGCPDGTTITRVRDPGAGCFFPENCAGGGSGAPPLCGCQQLSNS